MKKTLKWLSIIVGGLIVIVILALLITPMFLDVQKYKPEIEKFATDAVGRPVTIGGDLNLSLFPWAGLSFADLRIGNPEGFQEKDFVVVKSFDARIKLLPLISKDIQIKRFVVEGPRIVLEKDKDGRGNWEGLGEREHAASPEQEKEAKEPEEGEREGGLPIKSLTVGEFAITDGLILWIGQAKGERKEISDLTLRLRDVSLDRPINLAFSAKLDNQPFSLEGDVGPIGKEPGKGTLSLDLVVKALNQLDMSLKGKIVNATADQQFDLALQISPFSPRKLLDTMGQAFPVITTDPKALTSVALKVNVKGDPGNISISDGLLDLDESKLSFSLKAKDFDKPDVAFDLNLDSIDVDRYMPPTSEEKKADAAKKGAQAKPGQKKTDYTPLRKLVLDGAVRVGNLKARGLKIQDVILKIKGKNGIFNLDPLSLKLYKGAMSVVGAFDVRKDTPKSQVKLDAGGIQVAPLIQDFMQKDVLEGTLKANAAIRMEGDDAERIKRTLNGKGDLLFKDGAIVGIDLAGMVRNVKATFGLAEKGAEKPRTDFAELHTPFTIKNGLVKTSGSKLLSPLIRLLAVGKADLVKEDIDFRVEPKVVATIKGQGDTMGRSGLMVPVLVTGTFSSPQFRPDLQGMLKQGLGEGIPKPEDLLKGQPAQGVKPQGLEEKAKGLLKGLPFGN
ncbi:AsmA family protein [bacterium]|nr:AsmA family protein [bacterium]